MTGLRAIVVTSRPRFWLYLAGPVLVGLAFGAAAPDELTSPVAVALFLYFLVPANIYLYGVNDAFDADTDRHNPKKTGRERRFEGHPVTVAAIAASLLLGIGLVVASPAAARPWLVGFLVLATAYSVPPVRLKARPGLDSAANGLYILPGVAAYAALAGSLPPLAILVGAWLWTMAMHAYSAIPDIEPDRAAGVDTVATALGHRVSLAACGLLWTGAALAFATVDLRAGGLLAVYPLAVLVVGATSVDVARAYWAYPAMNAVVGMVFTVAGLLEVAHG